MLQQCLWCSHQKESVLKLTIELSVLEVLLDIGFGFSWNSFIKSQIEELDSDADNIIY